MMRIRNGLVLRTVMGQHIIVAEGPGHEKFNKIVSLNPSAALLWGKMVGKDFTVQDLTDILIAKYEVDVARAYDEAKEIAQKWIDNGLVDA